MGRALWAQGRGRAGHSHLRVQFGKLFLIQVGLFVDSGLVAELRPEIGYGGGGHTDLSDSLFRSSVWQSSHPPRVGSGLAWKWLKLGVTFQEWQVIEVYGTIPPTL